MHYKVEAEAAPGQWIELVRGEGELAEARSRTAELRARAHNRDVTGWRIGEFAGPDFAERLGNHEPGPT